MQLDDVDPPLSATTFVIVDLETTGGRAASDAITEIGAVKVRGGQVVGEFATLVDPGCRIPPFITRLTGITDAMVAGAPRIASVLPAFFEFARGCVIVAHNARFDVGFLKAAAAATDTYWPAPGVVCTVRLARSTLGRDEAPSAKLSDLARLFDVDTPPSHRALDDARATVDVLHGLIARAGTQGVHTLDDLVAHQRPVTRTQLRKRTLADGLPHRPGVYLFRGPGGEVLYVGTAVDLSRRVRTYFTGSETRARIKEMVALAESIDHVTCSHGLEAEVRELRLIGAHEPPYNRAAKQPQRAWWVTLSDEPFPRAVVRRSTAPDALGPFRSRNAAADAAAALADACGLRSCTRRIPASGTHGSDCSTLGAVGGCAAVTDHGNSESAADYAPRVQRTRSLIRGTDDAPLAELRRRIDELSGALLFENAARRRDGLRVLVRALRHCQRLRALAAVDEIVTARPDGHGGWELAVMRCGRLAAAGTAARGVPPMPVVEALIASAETVVPGDGPLRGAAAGETAIVARWIGRDGIRIVRTSSGYGSPVRGAARWSEWADRAEAGRAAARAVDPTQ